MICAQCQKNFIENFGQRYCSEECRYKARKARRRLKNTRLFTCEQCKREFWRNPDRAHKFRFCSQACVGASQRKIVEPKPVKVKPEPLVKVCSTCWTSFTPKYVEQKYCSRDCVPAPVRSVGSGNTLYLVKCGEFVKVGFTSKPFSQRLGSIRAAIPYRVDVLATRTGTVQEEQEFHQAHKDFLAEFGGREWYVDTPILRQDAVEFMKVANNETN